MIPTIISDDAITVLLDGKPETIGASHPNYMKVLDAIRDQRWDDIKELIDVAGYITSKSDGNVTVRDGVVLFKGREMHNAVTRRMLKNLEMGLDVTSVSRFLENLMDNPSYRAVQELYGFLESNELPITEDGCFLAYKRIRNNFRDIHSGSFDNSVGQVVEIPRNEVCEDSEQTCSAGLHFCSYTYLPHFGWQGDNDQVVAVKINPADVVSFPNDYENAKGRCCKYEVVDVLELPEDCKYDEQMDAMLDDVVIDMSRHGGITGLQSSVQSGEEDFGWSAEEIIQRLIAGALPPADPTEDQMWIDTFSANHTAFIYTNGNWDVDDDLTGEINARSEWDEEAEEDDDDYWDGYARGDADDDANRW
jgi:hypothetical protein